MAIPETTEALKQKRGLLQKEVEKLQLAYNQTGKKLHQAKKELNEINAKLAETV